MNKKYEVLQTDFRTFIHPYTQATVKVHRIIYTKDITWTSTVDERTYHVRNGTLGGFIQKESNLSQDDNSLIMNNAIVFGNAVLSNSLFRDTAAAFDDSIVTDTEVFGTARVFGKSKVVDSILRDNCNVGGVLDILRCYITGNSNISGYCKVHDTGMYVGAIIRGQSNVYDCELTDVSEICGISTVRNCRLSGRSYLKNVNVQNQTYNEIMQLNYSIQEGDLFPHEEINHLFKTDYF